MRLSGSVRRAYTDRVLVQSPSRRNWLDDALRLGPRRARPLVEHVERYYRDFCNGLPDMDDRTLLAAVAVP